MAETAEVQSGHRRSVRPHNWEAREGVPGRSGVWGREGGGQGQERSSGWALQVEWSVDRESTAIAPQSPLTHEAVIGS